MCPLWTTTREDPSPPRTSKLRAGTSATKILIEARGAVVRTDSRANESLVANTTSHINRGLTQEIGEEHSSIPCVEINRVDKFEARVSRSKAPMIWKVLSRVDSVSPWSGCVLYSVASNFSSTIVVSACEFRNIDISTYRLFN